MDIIAVIAAAAAAWLFGALWYMVLAKPWVAAAGIEVDEAGKPVDTSPLPFILSALCMLVVSGMLRHVLAMSSVDGAIASAVTGLGVGLFFISPWIMINNAYGGRPFRLTLIDGGYATFGVTIIGLVLGLF